MVMTKHANVRAASLLLAATLLLGGCGTQSTMPDFTVLRPRDRSGTLTGQDGITLFSSGNKTADANAGAGSGGGGSGGIGVNAYLWRGALETINFIPLASADPFGGLIITDWYQPANTPD